MASILFIQQFVLSQVRIVKYDPEKKEGYRARCPVCEFCGLPESKITIDSTRGEIRQCTCTACLATFRASGPAAAEIKAAKAVIEEKVAEIEKQVEAGKQNKKKNKKK